VKRIKIEDNFSPRFKKGLQRMTIGSFLAGYTNGHICAD